MIPSVVVSAIDELRKCKSTGDGTLGQLNEEELNWRPFDGANTIASIVRHLSANLRSRWTNFLTTDADRDRNRPMEFAERHTTRDEVIRSWEEAWATMFAAMESLSDNDLGREIRIKGEAFSVIQGIHKAVAHNSYHVGQIVYIGKQLKQNDWKPLS